MLCETIVRNEKSWTPAPLAALAEFCNKKEDKKSTYVLYIYPNIMSKKKLILNFKDLLCVVLKKYFPKGK